MRFAAARGATIQLQFPGERGWFTLVGAERVSDPRPGCTYRVHPKDAHLQYGPLSTALRDYALGLSNWGDTHIAALYAARGFGIDGLFGEMHHMTRGEEATHLFLVAEFLADEGL
jgi:hypothetical protein